MPLSEQLPDTETLAMQEILKTNFMQDMSNSFKKGDWDTVYKKLMILKLLKELGRDILLSNEEFDAYKNMLLA